MIMCSMDRVSSEVSMGVTTRLLSAEKRTNFFQMFSSRVISSL